MSDISSDEGVGDSAVAVPRRRGPGKVTQCVTAGALVHFVFVVTGNDSGPFINIARADPAIAHMLETRMEEGGPFVIGLAAGRYELLYEPFASQGKEYDVFQKLLPRLGGRKLLGHA